MTKNAAKQKANDGHEEDVIEQMMEAHALAESLFGTQANLYAAQEIYTYLQEADDEAFTADIKRLIEHAKVIFKTEAPTPEQVFWIFEEVFEVA